VPSISAALACSHLPSRFAPHFGLFTLVTAGRAEAEFQFEMRSLREHLEVYLGLLVESENPAARPVVIDVRVSDTARDENRLRRVPAEVFDPLAKKFPKVDFTLDSQRKQGLHYYNGLCLSLDAQESKGGEVLNLADGGFTIWTQRLLANAKERLLVSGIGIELLARSF
jgi:hypothetical protein